MGLRSIAPRQIPKRSERIVVSLSTIPSRAGHLRSVLNSLLDQSVSADRIVLALPSHSARENIPYPSESDLDLPPGVDVISAKDVGPITKLLPTLAIEPDAIIVVVDDDVIYPYHFLETLLDAHRAHPHSALAYRGVRIDPARAFVDLEHVFASGISVTQKVDIIFGTWGYLLPPGALDDEVFNVADDGNPLRWVDDVWVSGHLARRGVERLIVPATELPIETLSSMRVSLSEGPNHSGENDRRAIEAFSADW